MWYAKQNMNGIALTSIKINLIDKIILYSGATNHIFGNRNLLTNFKIIRNGPNIQVANGMKVQTSGIGKFNIFSKEIKDVLYLEDFSTNLLSIKRITKELNCNAVFSPKNEFSIAKVISESGR